MQKNIPKLEYHTEEYKQLVYGRWLDLKAECGNNNSNNPAVTMDQAWFDDSNLFFIWCVKQGFNRGYALRRRDLNSSWGPDNCYLNAISKATAKQYVYKGKSHTLSEWAAITGISQDILNSRIREGWSLEEAFHSVPKTVNRKSAQYHFNGEYHSIPEWSKTINVSESQLYSRAKYLRDHGKETDDLLMIVPAYIARQLAKQVSSKRYSNEKKELIVEKQKSSSKEEITYNGETHTLKEWSEISGINVRTIKSRLERQWPFYQAISIPPIGCGSDQKMRKTSLPGSHYLEVEHNGEIHTLKEWAEITGINVGTLVSRVNRGWSGDRLFDDPSKTVIGNLITYNGETLNQLQWDAKLGLCCGTIAARIKSGMTPEEAVAAGKKCSYE